MKRNYVFAGISILLVAVTVGIIAVSHGSEVGAPRAIAQKLESPAFYPDAAKATINTKSYKFDRQNKLLSYVATQDNHRLVFSMQPSPSEFSEAPDAYGKYLDKLNKITSFETVLGTTNIVEPDKQKGQAAIMNAHGTLLFVHSETKLSDEQWRKLFNSLQQR